MSKVLIEAKRLILDYDQYGSITYMKKRERKRVLRGLSFKLHEGEILGLIGRNGCGKSTTLSILADIIEQDYGAVNRNCGNISLLNFNSGMIPHLSGLDNIFLQGYFIGLSHDEVRALQDQIVELSELGPSIGQPVNTYSSGMKAKLGFAVGYHLKSDVILIDETLGVGDFAFREKSSRMMKEKILNNSGAIIVTHDDSLVRSMCTRCIVVHKGVNAFDGDPEEALAFYRANT